MIQEEREKILVKLDTFSKNLYKEIKKFGYVLDDNERYNNYRKLHSINRTITMTRDIIFFVEDIPKHQLLDLLNQSNKLYKEYKDIIKNDQIRNYI